MMNGARALLESLRQEGVEVVFGYPGGAVLTLYDEVYKMKFPHILTRHEQGAAHAADGYARASGKVGVVFATSGPGATNLVTGIATANMDSVPMVCITGQVANPYIGKDSFQEADIVGVTTPITKHNYLVKDVHDLPRVIKEAFFIARTWQRMCSMQRSTLPLLLSPPCADTAAVSLWMSMPYARQRTPSARQSGRCSLSAAASSSRIRQRMYGNSSP